MKNQMKGIALILFGILVAIASIAINIVEVSLIGVILGIIGVVVVFWNGDWKMDHKSDDNDAQ